MTKNTPTAPCEPKKDKMMKTEILPVTRLEPNDYNPNTMTEGEFAELVEEVRHLGRLPKPIIVRPNGDGYIIVDGEHGWRAAKEVGLAKVTCEVVEIDGFESMRQTYKRNQHGAHNPVLLGRMFRQMMDGRELSQRALAKEVGVSEGTIRNAIAYATAEELRNSYAPNSLDRIAGLSLRQIRDYLMLPAPVRDYWLDGGGDQKLLNRLSMNVPEPWTDGGKMDMGRKHWDQLVDCGLAGVLEKYPFDFAEELWKMWSWREHSKERIPVFEAYILPLSDLGLSFNAVMKLPLRREGDTYTVPVSPERWIEILKDADKRTRGVDEFMAIVEAAIRLEVRKLGEDYDFTDPRIVAAEESLNEAPDYIRDADLSLLEKLYIFDTNPPVSEDILEATKRATVERLEQRNAMVRGSGVPDDLKAQVTEIAAGITAEIAMTKALDAQLRERGLKSRDELFASRDNLMDAVMAALSKSYSVRECTINGQPVHEVMRERFDALPEPEFTLLAAYITGHEMAATGYWAKALSVNIVDPKHAD